MMDGRTDRTPTTAADAVGSAPPPTIVIRRAGAEDLARLADFYHQHFADRSRLQDMPLWQWQFLRNPLSINRVPFFLLEVDGIIEGAIGYNVAALLIGNRAIPASHPVNFFVNDRFRGLPALRLIKAVLADTPVQFAGYFSPDTLRLFSKLGFADLSSHVRCHYLPLANADGPRVRLSRTLRSVVRTGWWCVLTRMVAAYGWVRRYRFELHDSLPDSTVDTVATPAQDAVRLAKDSRYCRWRYAESPALHCRYLVQYQNDHPCAFAVIHNDAATGNAVILDIQPVTCTLLQTISLVVTLVREYRNMNVKMIMTHLLNKRMSRAFCLCLFGTTRSDIGLLVRCTEPALRAQLADPGRWHFVLGDTDRY